MEWTTSGNTSISVYNLSQWDKTNYQTKVYDIALRFQYFRGEYADVAFIYASDDMLWGRKNLKGINDLHFLGAGQTLDKQTRKEIVDPDAAVYDFALLVNCNHTIITRGTYSMWIALLAEGEYYSEYGPIMPPDLM